MSSRLIPWCLAATGFLAALTVFTWQGKLGDAGQPMQLYAAAGRRLTPTLVDHSEFPPSQAATASETPENVPQALVLPLPPATQPEPDPNLESVVDDAPTVEDLPARRSAPESTEDE
jgi:hypothetical protein